MDVVVARSKALLDEVGPLSHGFYTSGQLFLEEYYALAVLGKAGLGTPHMDGNTRLCTATAAAVAVHSRVLPSMCGVPSPALPSTASV